MTVRLIILWMVLGVFAAFGLYMVKFKVQNLKVQVAAAETQLREEKRNLHVLNAEWTYLNRPERLRQLTAKYLSVKPVQGPQLVDYANLPMAGMSSPVQPASLPSEPARRRPAKGITLASGAFHAQ